MRVSVLCLLAVAVWAGDGAGIRPRPNAQEYPVHHTSHGVTVAAAVIRPEQVSKLFATDLNKAGYIVVEVGIFPEAGQSATVRADDFMLRAGPDQTSMRASDARTIAAATQRHYEPPKPRPLGNIAVYPTATVGYETGGYDPVNGQRRNGVYTGVGVGIGVGGPVAQAPPPGSTDRDRNTMEEELADKGLPQGSTAQPVAGYLYFPRPAAAKKHSGYALTWYAESGQVKLAIPEPKK